MKLIRFGVNNKQKRSVIRTFIGRFLTVNLSGQTISYIKCITLGTGEEIYALCSI